MSCEKCWADAYMGDYGDQAARYQQLIEERKANPCTPREQAGEWWDEETQRDSRHKEPTVTITSSQFWEAAKAACPRLVLDGVLVSSEFIALANKLGLGDPE